MCGTLTSETSNVTLFSSKRPRPAAKMLKMVTPQDIRSPGPDMSPRARMLPDYFAVGPLKTELASIQEQEAPSYHLDGSGDGRRESTISFQDELPTRRSSNETDTGRVASLGRKPSTSSVSSRRPRYSASLHGLELQEHAARIRASSPPPESHVLDPVSICNESTSFAEGQVRMNDKQYQEDAKNVMQGILAKNGANRAVSVILEYAVGKLHATFQKLIQMYQPAMLIVGTRGRSLGGIQGLVNNRNSFSKYCLQYSPVPVVVVRPTEKRIKKKVKRANDSNRQTYLGMLSATLGKHEADSETSSTYELETQISPDEEAHQVAKVLGLPAKFDPTIKPINPSDYLRARSPAPSSSKTGEEPTSPTLGDVSPGSAMNSEDEEEEEDAEFDVVSGTQALNQQQKLEQLHKMEVGEAQALRQGVDVEDEEDDGLADNKPSP
ncbi:universal stress family domain [Cordyceps militaris]|uniref:Universal stress family domain n=1 Tax=Cordyceps militaris TaxID=73501 RepID=A0A2H4SF75_CORMI|nr:universal stress family domain [Cordyceps militaris]